MRAFIHNNIEDITYESAVLATRVIDDRYYYYVINNLGKLEAIPCAGELPDTSIQYIVERNSDHPFGNWEKKAGIQGYSWFIKDTEVLDRIHENKSIDSKFLARCIEQNRIELEWYHRYGDSNVIKNDKDIKQLKTFTFDFNLAEIQKIEWEYTENRKIVILSIYADYFDNIDLIFEGNVDLHFKDFTPLCHNFESPNLYFRDNGKICLELGGCGYVVADKLSFEYELIR